MIKILKRTVTLALFAVASVPAMAADMVLKAPPPRPPVASWSGFYLGLGAGDETARIDASVLSGTSNGVNLLPVNCFSISPCVPGEPFDGSSFRLSPYIGVNWQLGSQWLVGLEGDWGWADHTTARSGEVYPGGGFPFFLTGRGDDSFAVRTTWDASARGRLGFLVTPSFLLYATGGAAWLHVEPTSTCGSSNSCSPGSNVPAVITDAVDRPGWTVGGGIETMLWSNWFARGEYRYADFGTISNTDVRTCCGGTVAQTVSYAVRVRMSTATFGLAYKFGN